MYSLKIYACQVLKILIFLANFPGQGDINKDSTVWLGEAWPANICIPTSFPENLPMQLHGVPHKSPFASL
jgi:hypothetical protein